MHQRSPLLVVLKCFCGAAALLLLAGAGLHAQPEETGPVVMLPPLQVTESGTPLRWRYLQMPGAEILSVCDDATSEGFAQRLRRLNAVLQTVLPERFMAKIGVPEAIVLLDQKTAQARSREVLANMPQRARSRVNFMPNLRLADLDATGVFAVVESSASNTFTYTRDRIAFLLERRVPRLPDWFIEGALGFYQQFELTDRSVEVRSAVWLSAAESKALGNDSERPRTLLPLSEFFTRHRNKTETAGELDEVWRSQCALFVRWAIVGNKGANKEALWKFIDRLEKEAPSEALFREHFGIGYSDARDQLSDYLSNATDERTALPVPPSPRQRLRFRAATDLEVARIRGDWERMEIAYVRARSPTYVDKYIEQARRTLTRAYDRGEKDPRLLASLGLTEVDAGKPATARLYLEAAVQGNVLRPRAYYELSRLRYEVFQNEADPEKKLSAAQTAEVMAPLIASRRQDPPLLQTYALMLNVLAHSEASPTAEQLAMLHDGARYFPHIPDLVVRVIYLHLAAGQPAAATTLVELALPHLADQVLREKLERLHTDLTKGKI